MTVENNDENTVTAQKMCFQHYFIPNLWTKIGKLTKAGRKTNEQNQNNKITKKPTQNQCLGKLSFAWTGIKFLENKSFFLSVIIFNGWKKS